MAGCRGREANVCVSNSFELDSVSEICGKARSSGVEKSP
jgi:hypothetical protein